jgi:hypothetical protein
MRSVLIVTVSALLGAACQSATPEVSGLPGVLVVPPEATAVRPGTTGHRFKRIGSIPVCRAATDAAGAASLIQRRRRRGGCISGMGSGRTGLETL